ELDALGRAIADEAAAAEDLWRAAAARAARWATDPAIADAEAALAAIAPAHRSAPDVLALHKRLIDARAVAEEAAFDAEAAAIELRRLRGLP
ncbi:MAG: hypothetical protein H6703_17620, partial [Myxococcales bacterium]|nr:hypothetical protein [Myxococcales bacterium]